MNDKMRICQTGGKEISKAARVCPHCGERYNQPTPWLLQVTVLLIIMIVVVAFLVNHMNSR